MLSQKNIPQSERFFDNHYKSSPLSICVFLPWRFFVDSVAAFDYIPRFDFQKADSLEKGLERILDRFVKHSARPLCETATQMPLMSSIANVLGIKDPYTREHGRRVAIYARRLAERIHLSPKAVESIRLGGLLHDIGKIGMSDRVLKNTRSRLPDDLLAEVRLHPLIGVALLRDFDIPAAVIEPLNDAIQPVF